MSENEQVTPSSEQPIEQPQPTQPEQQVGQHVADPIPPAAADENASGAAETTDKGDGVNDKPTDDELTEAGDGDVSEPAPENPHTNGEAEGAAGLGVTGKFVHDDEAPAEADDDR